MRSEMLRKSARAAPFGKLRKIETRPVSGFLNSALSFSSRRCHSLPTLAVAELHVSFESSCARNGTGDDSPSAGSARTSSARTYSPLRLA